jgi:RNA polymerase-binding transcription factor DksA
MEKNFIDQQKKRLLTEQTELKARLSRIAKKDPNVKGDYDAKFPSYAANEEVDRNYENALEVEDYTNAIGVENILELRLAAVERALERIEKGSYGTCSHCKKEQPQARLEADPAAERCLDCGKLV